MRANLKLVEAAPSAVNRKVATPSRPTNASQRPREYVTAQEVEKLVKAAKAGRWGDRDAAMILVAYRHGLRAQEVADLEWAQVEEGRTPTIHVRRVKNGKPSAHPIRGDEMRALRKLPRETPYVFTTERGGQFTADAINRQVKSIGARAGLPFPVHAHMLRHGCGYALANAGHDTRAIQAWLGHANIQHTVRYTELAANRFASFWRQGF
jgi:type 1 fimbriae regulatory protein FimB/type 1 fimbriae regulatory protein FimE